MVVIMLISWYGSDNDDGGDRNVDRESDDDDDKDDCEMDKGKYDITTSILTMNCFLM